LNSPMTLMGFAFSDVSDMLNREEVDSKTAPETANVAVSMGIASDPTNCHAVLRHVVVSSTLKCFDAINLSLY